MTAHQGNVVACGQARFARTFRLTIWAVAEPKQSSDWSWSAGEKLVRFGRFITASRESTMNDTETWAMRMVEGGKLYLRWRPGSRWEVNFYERSWFTGNPFLGGLVLQARLADHYFRDQTFASPDEAAEVVRGLLANRAHP
jgi:hypothetical protein